MTLTRIYVGDEELVAEDPGALERLLERPLVARDLAEMPSLVQLYAVRFILKGQLITMNVDQINDGWIGSGPYPYDTVELHYSESEWGSDSIAIDPMTPIKLVERLEHYVYTYQKAKGDPMATPKRITPADKVSGTVETNRVGASVPVQAEAFIGIEQGSEEATAWLTHNEGIELVRNLAEILGGEIRATFDASSGGYSLKGYEVAAPDGVVETVRLDETCSERMLLAQLAAVSYHLHSKIVTEQVLVEQRRRLEEAVDEWRQVRAGDRAIKPLSELTANQRERHIRAYEAEQEFFAKKLGVG